MNTLVVGIGHPDRGDDGIGPGVAGRLRAMAPAGVQVLALRGDLLALIDRWRDAHTVIVVDAMRSGASPGAIRRIDVSRMGLATRLAPFASSHTVDLRQAIELARRLDRMPRRLIVYGIEAEHFAFGQALSAPVARALERVLPRILADCSRAPPQGDTATGAGTAMPSLSNTLRARSG